jgi:hypothetical protein
MFKKFLSIGLACILTLSVFSMSVLANNEYVPAEKTDDASYDRLVQKVLAEVNSEYGVDIQLTAPSDQVAARTRTARKHLTEQEIKTHLEAVAQEIAEDNAEVDRLFEEKTGIAPDEAVWYPADSNSNNITPFASQGYHSTEATWEDSWIEASLTGIINTGTYNTFTQVSKVTCSTTGSIGQFLMGAEYYMSSYTYSLIDARRTAAVRLSGTEYYFDAELGFTRSFSSSKYVEFYA